VYLAFTENPRCIRPGQAYSSALVAGAFPHSPSRCSDWQGSSPAGVHSVLGPEDASGARDQLDKDQPPQRQRRAPAHCEKPVAGQAAILMITVPSSARPRPE
jgi:hypothetical protein